MRYRVKSIGRSRKTPIGNSGTMIEGVSMRVL